MDNDQLTRRIFCVVTGGFLLTFGATAIADADAPTRKYRFEPVEGITASGQPTEEGLKELAAHDYVAIIDLRTDGEDRGLDEKGTVENLGMDYVSLPIAGRGALSFENAEKLDQVLDRYDKPVLVHCGSGNRAGALLALREKLRGADDDDALAFGRSAGMTSLEDTVKARLAGE